MQTTEEEQQLANQRLCTSPLHKLLGKPNQPRDGDLRRPFFETLETKPREDYPAPWCQLQQLKELEAAYQSTQVGGKHAPSQSK